MEDHRDLEGDFAEGEETKPRDTHKGSFAEGEEKEPREEHEGSFAEGAEEEEHNHERRGSFADSDET